MGCWLIAFALMARETVAAASSSRFAASSGQASVLPLCAQAGRNGMSIYLRGRVWYYLFYINGKRYRGSAKTKNRKNAERIEAKAIVAAEAGSRQSPSGRL
jgi:hypothetical protein